MSKTNKVQLIGNVGQKPKLIGSNEQSAVLTFSVATHDTFKDQQGVKQKRTEWHNVVAFGKVAGLIQQFVDQGSHVMVEGRLQTRNYLDKEGISRYATEIICEEILFLSSNKSQYAQNNSAAIPSSTNSGGTPF